MSQQQTMPTTMPRQATLCAVKKLTELKLTQWFSPDEPPVHPGPYQTCESPEQIAQFHSHGYQYWNGEAWGYFNSNPDAAEKEACYEPLSSYQRNYWRGVVHDDDEAPGMPL